MTGLIQDINLVGDDISWLKALRNKLKSDFKFPTPKDEAWKYTKLRDLEKEEFTMITQQEVNPKNFPDVSIDSYQIHFINGRFNPFKTHLPDGVEVMPLVEALAFESEGSGCGAHCSANRNVGTRDYVNKLVDLKKHPFASLNAAYLQEGVFLRVDKNTKLDKPLVLLNHTVTEETLFYNMHNVIVLEEGAEAEFFEVYTYEGIVKSKYFGNHVNEVFLGANSKINHYKFQDEAFYATHIALTSVEVKKDAEYNYFAHQKGANLARNELDIKLKEENAQTVVNASYMMNGWATIDTTSNVEHLHPHTYSTQLIKGVVGGDARGVFQGKIHIAKDAVKTEGNMLHKAILLSDKAEIDCKPELEIFADDVKCSHGAATGELDEQQLFYMQSRGINLEDAKQILIDAYLEDVFGSIKNKEIKEWVQSHV